MRQQLFTAVFGVGIAIGLSAPAMAQPPASPPRPDNPTDVQKGTQRENRSDAQRDKHGFLGVMVAPAGEGQRGMVVRDVAPDSPAAKAGLKSGDRIIKVGDQEPKDVEGFMKALAAHKPGEKVKLMINRDGKEQTVSAALAERPATARRPDERGRREDGRRTEEPGGRTAQGPAYLGVTVQPVTPEARDRLKLDVPDGMLIVDVVPNSPAEKAGLKKDDVITSIGDQVVRNPEDLREAIQQTGAGKQITLGIIRGGEKTKVKATPQASTVGYFGGEEGFPSLGGVPSFDQSQRIRELEHRISDLEKRIRDMERSRSPSK